MDASTYPNVSQSIVCHELKANGRAMLVLNALRATSLGGQVGTCYKNKKTKQRKTTVEQLEGAQVHHVLYLPSSPSGNLCHHTSTYGYGNIRQHTLPYVNIRLQSIFTTNKIKKLVSFYSHNYIETKVYVQQNRVRAFFWDTVANMLGWKASSFQLPLHGAINQSELKRTVQSGL